MSLPRISVIIPALNEEHYLPGLLRSLGAQRGVALEIIVVEGNSDDRTVEVAREAFDTGTNIDHTLAIHTVARRNVSFQRNHGVERSANELLLFLDSDVVLPHEHWVGDVVDGFYRRRAAVVTCRFQPIERHLAARLNYYFLYLFQRVMRFITPYAMGAMLLMRRDVFDRVDGFDASLSLNEDANLVKKAARFGPFRVLPDFCYVSARRFIRGGYFRTGLMYLRVFINRTLHGENTAPIGKQYWRDQTYDKPL